MSGEIWFSFVVTTSLRSASKSVHLYLKNTFHTNLNSFRWVVFLKRTVMNYFNMTFDTNRVFEVLKVILNNAWVANWQEFVKKNGISEANLILQSSRSLDKALRFEMLLLQNIFHWNELFDGGFYYMSVFKNSFQYLYSVCRQFETCHFV